MAVRESESTPGGLAWFRAVILGPTEGELAILHPGERSHDGRTEGVVEIPNNLVDIDPRGAPVLSV